MNIIGAKLKEQVIPSLQKSPGSEAPEPRIPRALASKGGECGANWKNPQRNEPELWTQAALCCRVTLNQVPSLSGPQCPCESNEGLGRGGLRTQAASLHPEGWGWGRQGCSWDWEGQCRLCRQAILLSASELFSRLQGRGGGGAALALSPPRSTEPVTGTLTAC